MTPIILSLTVYYIPLVKNNLLTSLSAVLCTKIINVLVMIFRTTHSPWPPPPYFMQILMKPQQKEDVQSWCKSKEALWVVRFRDLDKKRGVGVLREWPGAQPGKQVEVSLGHQTGWCVLTAESCPESWLGVDWGSRCARPAEWEWSDLSGCSLLFFYPFLFPHPSSHIPAPRD